jgi:hypothetical protein
MTNAECRMNEPGAKVRFPVAEAARLSSDSETLARSATGGIDPFVIRASSFAIGPCPALVIGHWALGI